MSPRPSRMPRRSALALTPLAAFALTALLSQASPAQIHQGDVAGRTQASPTYDAAIAAQLAPAVWLAGGDDNGPMSSHTFTAEAELRWAHDSGCSDDSIDTTPDETALGAGSYTHQAKGGFPGCSHGGAYFSSDQAVRPYSGGGPDGAEGFFLDMDNALHPGGGTGSPTYVQFYRGAYVYWFLYGWNDAPLIGFDHEGDWERVAVQTDSQGQPTNVTFWQHSGSCYLPWSSVGRVGGHPVVYSASGTHASYASAGNHDIPGPYPDVASEGNRWNTWGNLDVADAQAWWGYGGGWGEVGNTSDQTGPQGPNPIRAMGDVFPSNRC